MAVDIEDEEFTGRRTMRKIVGNHPKLLVDQKVEVRSSEEGFLGSWHSGTVIACEIAIRLIQYDNLLSDDHNSKNLVDCVKTSEMIDGIISTNSTPSNYRGWIRPLPPPLDWNTLWLHYGQCVDVFHKDAWWEGVVFDHEDGSLERIIFFPDMGDELKAHKSDLRITQDWDESNEVWKPRGDWLFLELIEEIENNWPLVVSVKQIWYDVQLKNGFPNLKEWTSSLRDIWKELVLQVVVDNFKLSVTEFFHRLISSENLLVELNEPVLDALLKNEAYFGDSHGTVPFELTGQLSRGELLPADIKKVCCRPVEEEEIGWVKNELSRDSYCNNYKGFSSTNCKVPTLRKRHAWFPAGPDVVPKAEFCVDAINEYWKDTRSYDTTLNVRKHLSFLGWKIEFTIKGGERQFRYIEPGPNGKHFQSLVKVCEYLRESTSKPDELSPATNSKTPKHTWQPAGLDIVPEAEFCEDAIIEYYKKSKARHMLSNDLKLKARKHLSFLGWKMEYLQEKERKWRYTRPSGVGRSFDSLLKVCEYLKKSASDIGSPIPQDDHSILIAAPGTSSSPLTEQSQGYKEELVRPSLFQLIVEPEYCPEAIVNYYLRIWKRDDKLSLKARRHLSFVGWKFYYVYRVDEVRHKRVFRYSSPNGRLYYTLLAACKACIDEGISDNKAYDSEQSKIRHISKNSEGQLARDARRSLSEKQQAESSGTSLSSEVANVGKVEVQGIRKRGRKRKSSALNLVYSKEIQALKSKDNLNGAVTRVDKNAEGQVASDALCSPLAMEVHGTFVSQRPPSEKQPAESSGISLSSEVADLGEVQGIKKRGRKRKSISINLVSRSSKSRSKDSKEGEDIKSRDNLNGAVSTRVLRSSKRISQVVVPSSSHSNPQTVLSWLIDNNVVLPRAKVQYRVRRGARKMAEGRVTRDGIRCSCCQDIFTLSNFETHAGGSYHQPSANILLEDGRSLLECQLQLIRNIDARSSTIEQCEVKGNQQQCKNDDICSVCHFGGELVLCDQCPSSFHTLCLDLKEVPEGDWFCPSCCCKICGQSKINVDVERFMDKSVINCHQCDLRYHIGCLRKKGLVLDSYPTGHWFCNRRCEQVFLGLQKVLEKPVPVGVDNLTWTLLKYTKADSCDNDASNIEDISENYSKLNIALRVMHECFEPVKEIRSGRDLVEDVIFNRRSELNHLNYRGFYTVLLEKNDELISAATVRVYGEKVAEIPLVATRFLYRRRGMCHILMNELEKALAELGVERLVLPAVSSLLDTWISSFGFSIMTQSERYEFLDYNFLDFQGTVMCQKVLLKTPSIESAPLGAGQQFCDHNDGNDIMDLDESSPVSEVFQANRIADSAIADQNSPLLHVVSSGFADGGNGSDGGNGTAALVLVVNRPTCFQFSVEAFDYKENEIHGNAQVI